MLQFSSYLESALAYSSADGWILFQIYLRLKFT